MKYVLWAAITAICLTGCSNKAPDLKSPCVGAEGSPCDRHPVNQNWQRG